MHLLAQNRDPEHWRDSQRLEHVLGKYIISDKPMTEEQWARERATVIDAEPVAAELIIFARRDHDDRDGLAGTSQDGPRYAIETT